MFSSRIHAVSKSSRTRIRHHSSSHSPPLYPSKVRAYPFAHSLQEATRQVGVKASICTTDDSGILSSLLARHVPWLGFRPKQPTQATAAYLPAWIIDAKVEGKAFEAENAESGKMHSLQAQIKNSYMPGFDCDPLSQLSLKDMDKAFAFETVPWSQELANQHGIDIHCLPYMFAPFSVPDAFRIQLVAEDTGHSSVGFKTYPESLNWSFIAAYPVLMPVYILQYEYEIMSEKKLAILVHDASQIVGRMDIANNVLVDWEKPGLFMSEMGQANAEFQFIAWSRDTWMPSLDLRFTNTDLYTYPMEPPPAPSIDIWLAQKVTKPGTMKKYLEIDRAREERTGGRPAVDWDDLRIREYTPDEVAANMNYMTLSADIDKLRALVEDVAENSPAAGTAPIEPETSNGTGSSTRPVTSNGSVQDFTAEYARAVEQREDSKPQWFKEWEKLQSIQDEKLNKSKTL